MIENIAVGVIIGVVLILAGKSLYKTLTGKNDHCGNKSCCGGCCRENKH